MDEYSKEIFCDRYCKWPEYYLSLYEDPDDANTEMMNDCCAECPLDNLCDE